MTCAPHPAGSGASVPDRRAGPDSSDTDAPDRAQRARMVARRLTARIGADGAPHAALAAAVVAARGRRRLGRDGAARELGIPVALLSSVEEGRRPPLLIPRRLRQLDPTVDWDAVGLTAPGHPTDPASRHPSARAR